MNTYSALLIDILRFSFASYYLCSIIFRLSFRQNVRFSKDFLAEIILDYIVDAFFWIDLTINIFMESQFWKGIRRRQLRTIGYMKSDVSIAPDPAETPEKFDLSITSMQALMRDINRQQQHRSHDHHTTMSITQSSATASGDNLSKGTRKMLKYAKIAFEVIVLIPFEVFGYLFGYKLYHMLRIIRLGKVFHIQKYWNDIISHFERFDVLTSPSSQRVLSITVFMVLLAHLGACAFYALALGLMENSPSQSTWLTHDGIVAFTGDAFEFTRSLTYRYVRALYWSVVTEQTVGFGDVIPISVYETCYTTAYMYLALVLAQLAIGNLILLFNVYDSAQTKYTDQTSALKKYAQFRSLPTELTDRIKSFYFHQWKILNGLDESELMMELPQNVKAKIKQSTIRKYLKSIKRFRQFGVSLLNALTEDIRIFMYSPYDVIVSAGSKARGMYIVSRGEAFIHTSSQKHNASGGQAFSPEGSMEPEDDPSYITPTEEKEVSISQALRQGEAYGVRALFEKYMFTSTLSSGACVSEILFLSRSNYRRTCRLQLNDEDYLASTMYNATSGPVVQSAAEPPGSLRAVSGLSRAVSAKHTQMLAGALHVEEKSKLKDMMKPSSRFREVWDLIIFSVILFYSISIPLLIADALYEDFGGAHAWIIYIGYVLDVFAFGDLCLRCFCFSYVHESILFSNSRDIMHRFLETQNVLVEILRHFPFVLFTPLSGTKYFALLRLGKILHLGRISDYSDRAEKTLTGLTGWTLSFTSRRFINLYFELFMLCHWVGCFWQFIADASTKLFGYGVNWKMADRDSEVLHMVYDGGLHGFSAYRRGIYWAINGMATTGTGDMPSTNMIEMVCCCVILLGGCQTINALLGSIASLMANINQDKRRFEEKIATVKKLLRFKNIPKNLEEKILFSYQYRFAKTSGVDEVEVLDGLPQPLREACVKYVAGSVLVKIPFFANCAEPMLERILGLLHHRLFLDGDAVVTAGEYGKDLYVIESGNIIVTSPDKKIIYASLVSGDYIGESCLLQVTQRSASAFATDYSDTYILNKDDFQKVLDSFPTESEAVVNGIKNVLAEKIRKNQRKSIGPRAVDPKATMPLTKIRSVLNIQNDKVGGLNKMETLSESEESKKWTKELEEDSQSRRLWDYLLCIILMYNIVLIPLRLALDIHPVYFAIDYTFDIVLFVDVFMKATMFRRKAGGRHLVETDQIRAAYISDELQWDLPARFPYELFIIFLVGYPENKLWWFLKILRIPKLLLSFFGGVWLNQVDALMSDLKVSFVTWRLFQVLCACVLVGHYLGCGLYLFSKVHLGDCVPEPDAAYGSACQYSDTWIEFLIEKGKLSSDGDTQFSRYIAALEWSIPTMMLYVIGDVYPMNMNETSYVYGAMFFGITINAMIVGSIISLVTTLDESRSAIATQLDVLKEHLTSQHVKLATIHKVTEYLKFLLTDTGQLIKMEQGIISDLPYSLQVNVNEYTKMKYFRHCQFFDFCDVSLLNRLCMRLSQANYYTGDMIVHFGDLGQEMYFVESGTVEVVSTDFKTVFAKIDAGGFFGETGLVYRSRRTANIRAVTICTCYILTKEEFDSELQGCNIEESAAALSLDRLQKANARMNSAVMKNLAQCTNPEFKLSRIIGTITESQEKSWKQQLADPQGMLQQFLDVAGLLLLFYYIFTVPFEVAFLFEDHLVAYKSHVMPLDFCVDFLCILELLLRVFVFPLGFQQMENRATRKLTGRLYHTKASLIWDVIGSLPLEIFAAISSLDLYSVCLFRLVHLVRLMNFFPRLNQVEGLLARNGLSWHRTTIMVVKSILVYVIANHWTSCVFFIVHRVQPNMETWVVADGYASFNQNGHHHDICNTEIWKCYQRAMYYVASVLTSVGYGDIAPYTDLEKVAMQILAIIAGALGANLAGQLMSYLSGGDKCGTGAFKEKLRSVENYVRYRGLSEDIRAMILLTYHTMWNRERRTDYSAESFLGLLSRPLAAEVALELNRSIIEMMVVTKHCRLPLHGRIALALRPQILLPNSEVYSANDTGHCLFFVLSGAVHVSQGKQERTLDEYEIMVQSILEVKHGKLACQHSSGTHFGEFCLISPLGLRLDDAKVMELTELYSFDKTAIWDLFRSMPFAERYRFILSLFTETGSIRYTESVIPSEDNEEGKFDGDSIKVLYSIATMVVEDVVEAMEADASSCNEDEDKDDEDLLARERRRLQRFMSTGSAVSQEEMLTLLTASKGSVGNPWTRALLAFDKGKLRRKSSVSGLDLKPLTKTWMRRESKDVSDSGVLLAVPAVSSMSSVLAILSDPDASEEEIKEVITKHISDVFLYMDKDKSGNIDRNKLMLSLFDMGIEMAWSDVDDMISSADSNGNKLVSLEEFIDVVLVEIRSSKKHSPSNELIPAPKEVVVDHDKDRKPTNFED